VEEVRRESARFGLAVPEHITGSGLLVSRLEKYVGCAEYADLSFVVNGLEIPAHKLILRARSQYFNNMLKFKEGAGDGQGGLTKITIQDCHHNTFLEVLRYLYTGHCNIDPTTCVEILEQANLMRMDRLTTMCEQFWYQNIDDETAATILEVADHYNAYQLKQFAMEYIFQHVKEVVKTQAWRELDIDLVSAVLIAAVERGK